MVKSYYMNNNVKEILEDLLREERMEEDLISLYSLLLKSGVENCLVDGIRIRFYKNLEILMNDSKRHKEIIANIMLKYK